MLGLYLPHHDRQHLLHALLLKHGERGSWVSRSRLNGGRYDGGAEPRVHYCAVQAQRSLSSPALAWSCAQAGVSFPSPRPSPTQKSPPASPHLSPSPSGNKIKVARDATTVLRKTQLLSVETADPGSCRAGSCPGAASFLSSLGSYISALPELRQSLVHFCYKAACSETSQATLKKEKPT